MWRVSVGLSVRLSQRSTAAAVGLVGLLPSALRVGDIDRQLQAPAPRTSCRRAGSNVAAARRSASNAGSVKLTADEGG